MRRFIAHPLIWIAVLLMTFSAVAMGLIGPIGYTGDGWLLVDKAFWEPIAQAYHYGALALIRPVMTFHTITAMKLFDYDTAWLLLGSFALLATSAVLMGLTLDNAFPGKRAFVAGAVALAFFNPVVNPLAFEISRENTRIVMVYFWLTVWLYQYWAVHPRQGLLPAFPILTFCMGLLTYESVIMLPPVIGLLILPVYWRHNYERRWLFHIAMLVQWTVSVLIAIGLFYYIRFLYGIRSGFEDVAAETGSQITLFFDFLLWFVAGFPRILWQMLTFLPYAPITWAVGGCVGLLLALILWRSNLSSVDETSPGPISRLLAHPLYILLTGLALALLGILPFVAVQYQPPDLLIRTRLMSTASYGLAILLAVPLLLPGRILKGITALFIALLGGLWAAFTVDVGLDYREANAIREGIHQSWLEALPAVEPDTTLIILNPAQSLGDFGIVNSHVGMTDFVAMFYQDRLQRSFSLSDDVDRAPIVTSDTFTSDDTGTIVHEQVILLAINKGQVEIVDCITPDDDWNIRWQGNVVELCSNTTRISTPNRVSRFWRLLNLDTSAFDGS